MRSLSFALLAITMFTILFGSPNRRIASATPHPNLLRPHTVSTSSDEIPAPTQQKIQAELATQVQPPPGVQYVENLPLYPPDDNQPGLRPFKPEPATIGSMQRPAVKTIPRRFQQRMKPFNVPTSGANNTGINRWWAFQGDSIGGVGNYLVNVANGNLLVQASDMAVPHKGIALAFRRTYNSFSQHDYANSDQSVVNNYGDGWTNTFDMHIAYNDLSGNTGVSVFDGDGTRYDYSHPCNPTCSYSPPPGQHATLTQDPLSLKFSWKKKDGNVFFFHDPNDSTTGVAGRLSKIWGRNRNIQLTFTYFFDLQQQTDPQHLNKITVQSETTNGSAITATLLFDTFSGTNPSSHRLLASIQWPNTNPGNPVVTYQYDQFGRLMKVTELGNDPSGTGIPQWYQWYSGGYSLQSVNGGRWANSNGTDGGYIGFAYTGNAIANVKYYGWVNPKITDDSGTGLLLQPAVGSRYGIDNHYRRVTFAFPSSSPVPAPTASPAGTAACTSAGSTPFYDNDNHEEVYCWDSMGRIVQTDAWTGTQWLVTTLNWDSSNNLVAAIDPRNNRTDYAYDSNGNTIAVGLPQVTTSAGTFRPTSMYVFTKDSNGNITNNIAAYCDPVFIGSNGYQNGNPSPPPASTCVPNAAGVTTYTWSTPSPEPFGELTKITTPGGYNYQIAYSPAPQQGLDYGLPTSVQGDQFAQQPSPDPSLQPQQTFIYDNDGNMICSNSGVGWTVRQFDFLERLTAVADPDDDGTVVSGTPCGKVAGPYKTAVFRSYLSDGSIKQTQSSAQLAHGVQDTFAYDADGNETSITTLTGGIGSTKTMWYDGAERMIEVKEPNDPRSWPSPAPTMAYDTSGPLLTRYYYDLSNGGTVSIGSQSGIVAHGAMYKTLKYLTGTWQDIKGSARDPLDRVTTSYYYAPGISTLQVATATYDVTPYLGMQTGSCNGAGGCQSSSFDAIGRTLQVTFSGVQTGPSPEPGRTYMYDPDGRVTSVQSDVYGTQTYAYDVEGRLIRSVEPSPAPTLGVTSPATLTYDYYPNGWKEDVNVSSTGWSQSSPFPAIQYSYRVDGKLAHERFNMNGLVNHTSDPSRDFTWTYTAGGRTTQTTDPYYNPAHTLTFDSYGRVQSYTLPAGSYSNLQYDDEGAVVHYETPQVFDLTLNVRGELAFDPLTTTRFQSNSGVMIPQQKKCSPLPCIWGDNTARTIDLKNDVVTGTDQETECCSFVFSWSYDGAARQTTTNGTFPVFSGSTETAVAGSYTRTFDIEDHVTSQSFNTYQTNYAYPCGSKQFYQNNQNASYEGLYVQYEWGPNGHPLKIGSTALGAAPGGGTSTPPPTNTIQYETVHWDGNAVLFSTNSNGQVDDIKAGSLGDLTPLDTVGFTGFTVWDRDTSGEIISSHNNSLAGGAVGHGTWSSADPYLDKCRGSTLFATASAGFKAPSTFAGDASNGVSNLVGRGGLLIEPRADGISDGYNTIQGARSYDSEHASWTSPDAFPGVVSDPQSQRPYQWNRNNSLSYSDPSGFYAGIGNQGDGSLLFDPYSEGSFTSDSAASMQSMAALAAYMSLVPLASVAAQTGLVPDGLTSVAKEACDEDQSMSNKSLTTDQYGQNGHLEYFSMLYHDTSDDSYHHGPARPGKPGGEISEITIDSGISDTWHLIGYAHSHPDTPSSTIDENTHGHFSRPDISALGPGKELNFPLLYGFVGTSDNRTFMHIYGDPDSKDYSI